MNHILKRGQRDIRDEDITHSLEYIVSILDNREKMLVSIFEYIEMSDTLISKQDEIHYLFKQSKQGRRVMNKVEIEQRNILPLRWKVEVARRELQK